MTPSFYTSKACVEDDKTTMASLPDAIHHVWPFLTVAEMWKLRVLSKGWKDELAYLEYDKCRDGRDYMVPFPGFPGLLRTPADIQSNSGLFPHQIASVRAMQQAENRSLQFGDLRGGILGDAPGLGKTITMLALISSTVGIRPVAPPEFWNFESIDEDWKWIRQNAQMNQEILQVLKPVRKWVEAYYGTKVSMANTFRALQEELQPPFQDNQFLTMQEYESYTLRAVRKISTNTEVELVRQKLQQLKGSMDKRNRKLRTSQEGRRLQWERNLIATSGTLIIVPDALLEHWCQQIKQHLEISLFGDDGQKLWYGADAFGVVYIDGIGDLASVKGGKQFFAGQASSNDIKHHVMDLARYQIVVTTFSRCQNEMDREWLRTENCTRRKKKRTRDEVSELKVTEDGFHTSSFLQLRWLRLVVDEGHELGTHEAADNVTHFINRIAAERRWVLSGTPTTGDVDDKAYTSNSLDQIQRLLYFLRHPKYGIVEDQSKANASSAWMQEIKAPFLQRNAKARQKLMDILKQIMVMHRKEDIELPKPVFNQVERDVMIPAFKEDEPLRHNDATVISLQLDNYLHSGEFQSRVDQAQAQYVVETIRKARQLLAARGGPLPDSERRPIMLQRGDKGKATAIHPSQDRRPIKAVVYSAEKNNLLSVADQIIRMIGEESVAELYDTTDIGEMSSELARFREGASEFRVCPICQQRAGRPKNHRMNNVCPTRLMQVVTRTPQPRRILIEPERVLRTLNVSIARMEGETMSSYSKHTKFWRVGDTLEIDLRSDHPLLPPRRSEKEWESFGSKKCRELAEADGHQGQDWYFGELPSDSGLSCEAVLVKWLPCGRYHNHSRWYKGPQLQDAPIQRETQDVPILSLDAGLSHGLDLSFVTHMFLLEPIDDAALLEQVTSRAHRLGCTGPVTVDTIHTFFKIGNERLQKMLEESKKASISTNQGTSNSFLEQNRKALSKIVCQHCYRQFDSMAVAEEHEQMCPRNPDSACQEDAFHLSSVYRELRPPLPAESSSFRGHNL